MMLIYDDTVHRGIGDTVCDTIRKSILSGQLSAGDRLVEAKIAKELHVSITPVRQAFATLAGQGLLNVFPYKGTYVTVITQEYTRDVITMREALELAAFRLCSDQITDEDVSTLEELCLISDRYNAQGDLFQAVRYDVLFHEHFFRKADRALLLEMWSLLRSRIEYIQSYTKKDIDFYHMRRMEDYAYKRHVRLLDALKARDNAEYEIALLEHLRTSRFYSKFPFEVDVVYK